MTYRIVRLAQGWSPWSGAEGVRWALLAVAGHGLCGVGWWMATHRTGFDARIPAIEVAVVGLVLVVFADISWLLRARFALMTRRDALLSAATEESPTAVGGAGGDVVGGPGLERYHRLSCPLVAGKDWPVLADGGRGRRPCGVCRP